MNALPIELLLLTLVLVNFRAIYTANIRSKSVKEFKRNRLYSSISLGNSCSIM